MAQRSAKKTAARKSGGADVNKSSSTPTRRRIKRNLSKGAALPKKASAKQSKRKAGKDIEAKVTKPEQRQIDIAQDLTLELEHLHHSLDEMVDRYRVRVGAQLVDLLQFVNGDDSLGERAKAPTPKASKRMLESIRKADLKPKKGRAKDFVRLQDLVGDLTEEYPRED